MKYFLLIFSFFVLTAHADSLGNHPLILVHGFGPNFIVKMTSLKKFLVEEGISEKDIHLVDYSYLEEPDVIATELASQFDAIYKDYPDGTQFDVIAHSLGDFTAIYMILNYGMADHVAHYIGLAGVAHGQEEARPMCKFNLCGETVPLLVPYNNPFVTGLYDNHREQINHIRKCSLYSLSDKMVDAPHDSGTFPDGVNIEVPGYSHMDFIKKQEIISYLKQCY